MSEGAGTTGEVKSSASRRDDVLEKIAKRRSLKQIAHELCISESTVNYHVRALKELHRVNTLAQLADIHAARSIPVDQSDCRFSARRDSAMSLADQFVEGQTSGNGEPLITFNDAMDFKFEAPWIESEPQVVPGVLEGTNAGYIRGAAIVAIAVGMLALILLGLGVAQGITAALSGVEASPAQTV